MRYVMTFGAFTDREGTKHAAADESDGPLLVGDSRAAITLAGYHHQGATDAALIPLTEQQYREKLARAESRIMEQHRA